MYLAINLHNLVYMYNTVIDYQ